MDLIYKVVEWLNGQLWDFLLIVALCGVGLYFTLKLKFIQVRKFPESFKATFGSIKLFGKAAGEEGMTSFQSLATSIAAQVGTGNLAGVATAMVSGGAGAVFWMWISAFLGMAIIYAEATLAQQYKTTEDGQVVGGPVYYIQAAFKGKAGKVIAAIFSVLLIFALGFMGNMVQANSVGGAMKNAFNIPPIVTGIVMAVLALLIFAGGIKRIASVTEKLVPIMALFFLIGGGIVVVSNYTMIIPAFRDIFVGAFNPGAVAGGLLGVTVKQAIRFGIARGLFTHEAGMGSTPHAHALANVKHPCLQGHVAMIGVFIDTFIVVPITVLVVLTTGVLGTMGADGKFMTGIDLTQLAFSKTLGRPGEIIIAIAMLFFAFSTIVGWYFFGESNIKYLFGKKAIPAYTILVVGFIVVGCMLKVDFVWQLADLFNGLMVLPNLLSLFVLRKVVVKLTDDYKKNWKNGKLLTPKKS